MRPVHVAVESRERVAQTRGAPEDVRTPRDEPMPRDRAELCRYLSSRRRLTWRPATGARRCEGSFSYILLCHSCMAILTLPACREIDSRVVSGVRRKSEVRRMTLLRCKRRHTRSHGHKDTEKNTHSVSVACPKSLRRRHNEMTVLGYFPTPKVNT